MAVVETIDPQKILIVIPARQGSTRFPNKPKALVLGKSVLERTWNIAQSIYKRNAAIEKVVVASETNDILEFAKTFGAETCLTGEHCRNGTERAHATHEAIESQAGIIINLQADALLTPPWVLESLIAQMQVNTHWMVSTPMMQLSWAQFEEFQRSKANGRVSGTLVVFDRYFKALYFSKGQIPFLREGVPENTNPRSPSSLWRHIGVYAYRLPALEKYQQWGSGVLEKTEGLEQLRFLENGESIFLVPVDYRGRTHWSIDNPEDIDVAEQIIRREKELIK